MKQIYISKKCHITKEILGELQAKLQNYAYKSKSHLLAFLLRVKCIASNWNRVKCHRRDSEKSSNSTEGRWHYLGSRNSDIGEIWQKVLTKIEHRHPIAKHAMKPFTRVPQLKEVASITWKRGEKQKRNLFTRSSCLLPSAKTSSQTPRRVLSRHPPECPAGSRGHRGTGTRGGSAGRAQAGPPAPAAFSGLGSATAPGTPRRGGGSPGTAARAAALPRPGRSAPPRRGRSAPASACPWLHSPSARPAGAPCPSLRFPSLPRDYQPRQPPRPPARRR